MRKICSVRKKVYLCNPKSRTALQKRLDEEWIDSLAQLVEHNTFNVGVLGSSPKRITKVLKKFASLAQLVEHDTLNVGVQGSSP